jgi:hypothetical protein
MQTPTEWIVRNIDSQITGETRVIFLRTLRDDIDAVAWLIEQDLFKMTTAAIVATGETMIVRDPTDTAREIAHLLKRHFAPELEEIS